ncbi:uncharacterized protein LOC112084189 [Eutrema salsugineum]|uniref:uncharacterized protein LOC112084189 n=1 Tax=Eutrema salsugineum TaxID=72664 RepID=UPI000CED1C66|nr:uncharacterized protein LOC112084189 [Eutrema salsugineum]
MEKMHFGVNGQRNPSNVDFKLLKKQQKNYMHASDNVKINVQVVLQNDDIFDQAKIMLKEDPKYKAGWKFDHVWSIIKNFEKFKDGETPARNVPNTCGFGYASSESENPTPDFGTQASSGLLSLSLNLDDEEDIIGGSASKRPIGVRKAKLKIKSDNQTSLVINTLEEGSRQLVEQLKKTSSQRQHHLDIQKKG